MTEVDALLKIAVAIEYLAIVFGGIATVCWLALLFKSMSANSSISHLADVIEKQLATRKNDK
mgnify:CR=1 FL=1